MSKGSQLIKWEPVKSSPAGFRICVLSSVPSSLQQLEGMTLTLSSRELDPFVLGTQVALCGRHAYIGDKLYNQLMVRLRKLFVAVTLGSGREWAHNEYILNEGTLTWTREAKTFQK